MISRVIEVPTDSEIGRLLDEMGDTPIVLVKDGDDIRRYRQERFLAMLSDVAGA